MNERYTPLYDRTQVQQAVGRLASEITSRYSSSPLFVSLLHGATPFTTLLAMEMTAQAEGFHPHIDYMITSRDRDIIVPDSAEPEVRLPLSKRSQALVDGQPVIVLDNVLDQGNTYAYVSNSLRKMGASSVQLAVLIEKEFTRTNGVSADFVGLRAPAAFLVGMGMTDKAVGEEAFRWEGGIWQVRKDDDLPPQHAEPTSPLVSV